MNVMGHCDFTTACYFLNVKTADLPLTTGHAKATFCSGNFTACAIYRNARTHGIDKVPRYVSPDDTYELDGRLVENCSWDKLTW